MSQRRPHYHHGDSFRLMQGAPYISISNGGLLGLLHRTENAASSYRKFLAKFPEILCEPLEFLYQCRIGVDTLNVELLSDFLFTSSWREANWGAWLAMLSPRHEYRALLRSKRESLPHGTDIIDLAVASVDGGAPERLQRHFESSLRLRDLLSDVQPMQVPLRLWPTEAQEAQFNCEVELIREAYRTHGHDAASHRMRQGIVGYYGESYRTWVGRGAPAYV